VIKTPRFGFPPNYKLEQTGLFFVNGDTYHRREVPYSFHTNPGCHAATAPEGDGGASLFEVTIWRNLDNDDLFYVKPLDGKTVVVDYCGSCATSLHRLLKPIGPWSEEAACYGMPVDVFVPGTAESRSSYALALRVCGDCPVQVECLEHALETREPYGVWGGATPSQRERIRKARRKETLNA